MLQEYYSGEEESEASQGQADEEVAVTKRGRAVKLPAKYKAEVPDFTSFSHSVAC